jgi:hypothetical protein
MKRQTRSKNRRRLIIAFALILLLTALYMYNHLSYTAVQIGYLNAVPTSIETTAIQRQQLINALNDRNDAADDITSDSARFTIEMHHPLWGYDAYRIIRMDAEGVIIANDDNVYQAANAAFFYTQPYLEAIYSTQFPASANILNSENNEITVLPVAFSDWRIRKFDGNWYAVEPASPPDSKKFTINSTDALLTLQFDKTPDEVVLTYETANTSALVITSLSETASGYAIPISETDGTYSYHLTATWRNENSGYNGSLKYAFEVQYERPTVFQFSQLSVEQGAPVIITAKYVDSGTLPSVTQSISTLPQIGFYPEGANFVCLIPTNYDTKPGSYTVILDGTSYPLSITERTFNVQHLIIDETVAQSTRNEEATADFSAAYNPVVSKSSSLPLTSGNFILPVYGRLSTEFGETRDVNGSMTTYRHSGWDIAASKGTPVMAANSGNVVFSGFLTLTGNTIVIDHGAGIFSTYFHLDERMREAGDTVLKGDQIGAVGTTGFSTGPHLHFILSYYGVNMEPGWFLYDNAITYDNYKAYFSN